VQPADLRAFLANPVNKANNKQIVLVQFTSRDVVVKKDGSDFDKKEYYTNPERFNGIFEEYLDCVHFLVNDIYWTAKYPRLITKDGLKAAVEKGTSKFMGVTDISADESGSIEFTTRFTSIEEPFLLYDPLDMTFKEKIAEMAQHDILYTSVDHLPAEMPVEASKHFGSQLLPFVEAVVKSDISLPFENQTDLPKEVYNAIITANGSLTPSYQYISDLRMINEKLKDSESESSVGMQGFTLQLTGHLFDKQIFNRILDMFENRGVNFRVFSWQFG
jgi:alpha-aminoadipic semialdehyde synthase